MVICFRRAETSAYYHSSSALAIIAIGLAVLLKIKCGGRMAYLWQVLLVLMASGFSSVLYQMSQTAPFVSTDEPVTYFLNWGCCLLPYLFFYVVIGRVRPAIIAGGVFSLGVSLVNYFVNHFRGSSFLPTDIISAGTAMDVAGSYSFFWDGTLTMMALEFAALICWAAKAQPPAEKYTARKIRLGAFMGLTLSVSLFMTLDTEKFYNAWWDQYYGYPYTFCINLKMLQIKTPEGYSVAAVEEGLTELADENSTAGALIEGSRGGLTSESIRQEEAVSSTDEKPESPNIIAIMNESWGDFGVYGDFETNLPVSDFIDSLTENTIQGDLSVSVYGAGTCDSEYSFLTGNTTAFLPENARPYLLYVDESSPSLVQSLNAQNYKTVALHPGARDAWSRDTVYQDLGFQEFYSIEYFAGAEVTRGAYVSDASSYDKIIECFESKGNQPLFAFDVTIQNHGGYNQDASDLEAVTISGHEGEYPLAEQYLSLMRKTDQDFEKLIRYFEQVEEPTIIVMFGDHQGTVEPEFLELLMGKDEADWSVEELQQKYKTPYIIWANYPLEASQDEALSIHSLAAKVLSQTGLQETAYTRYLAELGETLPVINSLGVMDSQGHWYTYDETNPYRELIADYKNILYNNIFDTEERLYGLYTLEDQRTPEQRAAAAASQSETYGDDAKNGEIPEGLKVVAPAEAF
ncbi:MAG: LTA synthase family protein [Eubacterium sp.]|nr:LTA synthase family protein [Eubacterium sp.]